MTVARAKGDKGACDRLASQLVRMRGRCQYPGCTDPHKNLQAAHIIGRSWNGTRARLDNLLCLCASHHFLIDAFPDEKLWITETVYGEGHYDELREAARLGVNVKVDWRAERERLTGLLEAAGKAQHWEGM